MIIRSTVLLSACASMLALIGACAGPATEPVPTVAPGAPAPAATSPTPDALSPYAAPSPGVAGGPLVSPDTGLGPSPLPASATPGTSGVPAEEKTLRLQVLLDRVHFSPGEIDGRDGENTLRALESHRRERGGGLEADTSPHLVDYTVTAQDLAGPFTPEIPEDMMRKARLKALDYTSALEALGERFHASPSLLRALNPQATFTRAGERIRVPNVHTDPPGKAARVVVDGSGPWVAALDAQGRTLAVYSATAGSERDPLPLGDWKINGVSRLPVFNYNPDLFWNADESHAKARIPPGPNNPVGVVWIDLSKPHYGIHGTPEPSTIGKTQSNGCIRLTNWDADELAGMVAAGTPVLIRR
ncbi:MAG TPA: L,D-transpeptidase [Vicinamibacteria bacterium]|nr:L,D-transpeptidase [Vicinamibacteria bacterium]